MITILSVIVSKTETLSYFKKAYIRFNQDGDLQRPLLEDYKWLFIIGVFMIKLFFAITLVTDLASAAYFADRQEFKCQLNESRYSKFVDEKAQNIEIVTQNNKMLIKLLNQNKSECDFVTKKSGENHLYDCKDLSHMMDVNGQANVYLDQSMIYSKDGQLTVSAFKTTSDEGPRSLFVTYKCELIMAYFNLKKGSVFEKIDLK